MEIIEQHLKQWVNHTLSDFDDEISVCVGAVADKLPCVHCVLKEVTPAPPAQNTRAVQLQVTVNYLIFVSADSPSYANKILETLIFASLEDSSFEAKLEPCQDSFWLAMQMTPRPCFRVQMVHQKESSQTVARPVLKPMEMRVQPSAYLRGRLLAQIDKELIPLTGALISLEHSNVTATTGKDGCFNLGAVPANPKSKKLKVLYKESSQSVSVSVTNSPIEILFKTEEI